MDKLEKIIAELKADKENADLTDDEILEMAKMEIGADAIVRYEQKLVDKKPKQKKEIKLDDVKVDLIKWLADVLEDRVNNVAIANPQKEVTFTIDNDSYSISLIKHRPPKK